MGSVRAARVAEAFSRAGHGVDVVAARTTRADSAQASDSERQPPVHVHRVARLRNARELALAVRARLRRRASANASSRETGWIVPADVPRWKRFLVAMALLPDNDQGFILPAIFHVLRTRARFDLLYTSGPPHSAHVAGLILKRFTRVRWAAEFRDPWTDNAVRPRYAVSDTADSIKGWLERRVLAAADHVIAVSDSAGELFRTKMRGDSKSRVLVVRNGIPVTPPPQRTAERSGVRVLYLGSLYHGRDPRPFFQALAKLRAEGHEPALSTCVDFFGECRIFRGLSVQGFIDDQGLEEVVRLHDSVARESVPALMAGAHVLLLLAQQQPLQIPAKLYEYLGARRAILAFADEGGETAAMLRRVGGHFVIDDADPSRAAAILGQALAAASGVVTMDEALLEEWSADRQMSRLVEALAGES